MATSLALSPSLPARERDDRPRGEDSPRPAVGVKYLSPRIGLGVHCSHATATGYIPPTVRDREREMGDAGSVLAVTFTVALAVLFFIVLAAVVLRHWRRRRDALAASGGRGGFVLFDVCLPDDRLPQQRRGAPPGPVDRSRPRRAGRDQHAGAGEAAAADGGQEEPDESEIAAWKKIFGPPNRSLSTIDEGTEKGGTTPITTPAFCSPPGSPDRRDARTGGLDVAVSIAMQAKP